MKNLYIFPIYLGCTNTPKQGLNVCDEHEKTTTIVTNCRKGFELENECSKTSSLESNDNKESFGFSVESNNDVEAVIKILEKKETRHSALYKVINCTP